MTAPQSLHRLTVRQKTLKRLFDVLVAGAALVVFGWLIPVLAAFARLSTKGTGIFRQTRVGRGGKPFEIRKLRTMRVDTARSGDAMGVIAETTVTTAHDPRITRFGRFLRRTKLDELPQLINVLRAEMSLVGPRPDVAEFVPLVGLRAETVLSVAPGITGPATLVFRDEETLLSAQADPERYNRDVLVPAKAQINEHYVGNWRLGLDVRYLLMTVFSRELTIEEALS